MRLENNNKRKTLGPKSAKLVTTLYEQARQIFRLRDVQKILCLNNVSSCNFVRKLVNRGVVTRLKPGLYILVPFELGTEGEYTGNPLLVAREIMDKENYYFSHSTAMEIHGMLTQPQLILHITTVKPHRIIKISGTEIRFIYSQKKNFFGIIDHWVTKQEKIRVSDLERTIIDGLRYPEYCGGLTEVAKGLWIRRDKINTKRLINYARRINVGAVIRRLGFLLELYKIGDSKDCKILRTDLTNTYVRLDPLLPSEGKFSSNWKLQLNVSSEELLSIIRT